MRFPNDKIFLECFISEGEYVVLNDCSCYYPFNKDELVQVKFREEKIVLNPNPKMILHSFVLIICGARFNLAIWENTKYINGLPTLDAFINNLLPNLKKLTPDELMIKDIIT